MTMKLHNYQERAVDFMVYNKRCILSVGMGLGKTASVLHFVEKEYLKVDDEQKKDYPNLDDAFKK